MIRGQRRWPRAFRRKIAARHESLTQTVTSAPRKIKQLILITGKGLLRKRFARRGILHPDIEAETVFPVVWQQCIGAENYHVRTKVFA